MKLAKNNTEENISTGKFLDYKIVITQVRKNSEVKNLEEKVNKLIAQGYEPYGDIHFDHCSESCMDVIQVMVKYNQ